MINKIKTWIKQHPKSSVAIIAGLIVLIYYIYTKLSSSSTGSSTGVEYVPYDTSGGTSSGGSTSADQTALLDTIAQGFEGMNQNLSDAFAAMQENNSSLASNLAAALAEINADTGSYSQPVVSVPETVSQPALVQSTAPGSQKTNIFIPQESDYSSNSKMDGRPIMLTSPSGYTISLSDLGDLTAPLANKKMSDYTGKSGTIEQQLSGLTAEEKLAAIKATGLGY